MTKRSSAPKTTLPGLFVVIEGPDKSGKTTLARRLIESFRRSGVTVCPIREPGGTPLSERIRRLLLNPQSQITPPAELFLYLAARSQVVEDVIRPALARGELVIADRFSLSTIAYQVGGRGLPLKTVRDSDRMARGALEPDLTIVLSVTPKQQASRRNPRRLPDRIEREDAVFFRKVRQAYVEHGSHQQRHLNIDSGIGAEQVFDKARQAIARRLSSKAGYPNS